VGELAGKHLVTIEGLNQDRLSPIQQALVDWGATQCGFCTPGLVMSLTGYLLASPTAIDLEGVKTALHNNLCRCTGYGAIKRAALSLARSLGNRIEPNLENWIAIGIVPEYFRDLPDRLRQLPPTVLANDITSPEFVIAGGTDVYVQHGDRLPDAAVRLLNPSAQMKGMRIEGDLLHIGALTTFAEFASHPTARV
jgi:xanthine dehydrogenase small subunit